MILVIPRLSGHNCACPRFHFNWHGSNETRTSNISLLDRSNFSLHFASLLPEEYRRLRRSL